MNIYLKAIVLAATGFAAGAHAQAITPTQEPAASTNGGGQLEEILVTAQRRSERLQDVPIAVTSVSAATLNQQGVSTSSDLSQAVPSLVFNSQFSVGSPYIRGVGSDLIDPTSESPVAIYVDDVYIAAPQANIFSLAGIKQIDVLAGPQGTLFGRNATGGVIQVQTLDPSSELHVDAAATYGSYDFVSVPVYVTTGIGDHVATDFSMLYENQGDGYGHNFYNGSSTFLQARDNWSFRNKWVINLPTDTVLRFSMDYAQLYSTNTYQKQSYPAVPVPGGGATGPIGNTGPYNTYDAENDFTQIRTGGVSLKIDQDLGPVSLTSITAYRENHNVDGLDQSVQYTSPLIYLALYEKFHNVSQEFRIKNQTNQSFNWIAGAYYYNATGADDPLDVDGAPAIAFDQQQTESVAGFAQGDLTLFSNTDLTAGVRYTDEDQTFTFPAANMTLKQSAAKTTYRVALDHHFSRDVLAYVSYNTGFKSGGFNLTLPGNAFKPEELESTEVGIKSELFNHTLRLNVDGFNYQYTNQQVNRSVIAGTALGNAASSHIKGLEANLDYLPIESLKFSGGLSLQDGHYTNYPGYVPINAQGVAQAPVNAAGMDTIVTPHFVANASARYSLPTQVGEFASTVGVQHNSGFYWFADNRFAQPAYTILNASVSWAPNTSYSVKLWGKNLLDSTYYTTLSESDYPVGDNQEQAPPRTFGVTVSYHY
jgi:iron complex outermembrane recepter protein